MAELKFVWFLICFSDVFWKELSVVQMLENIDVKI